MFTVVNCSMNFHHPNVFPLDEQAIMDLVVQTRANQTLPVYMQLQELSQQFPHGVNLIEWLTANCNNLVELNEPRLWERHEFLYYVGLAKKELHITAKALLSLINAYTNYEVTYSNLRELNRVLRVFGIYKAHPYPFDKETIKKIQKIYDTDVQHYSRLFNKSDADNLLLRWYYNKEVGFTNKVVMDSKTYDIFPKTREAKLTFLDFNDEILNELPMHFITSICAKKELICPITISHAETILIERLQKLDKLYVIDIPHVLTYEQFEDALDQFIAKNPEQISLLRVLERAIRAVNTPTFTEKVRALTRSIADDLYCIQFMLTWNRRFIREGNELSLDYIERMRNTLSQMNKRQRCLCKQVFTSIVYMQNDVPTYHPNLIDIARQMLNVLPESCYEFVSNHRFISCYHETFHQYSLSKWLDIYCHWFGINFPGVPCTYPNVERNQHNAVNIYPKKGFCGGCYKAYKHLQNIDAGANRNDGIPVRFTYFILKKQLYFYRLRFSDLCDNEATPMHVTQANIQRKTSEKALEEIILAISKEQKEFAFFIA